MKWFDEIFEWFLPDIMRSLQTISKLKFGIDGFDSVYAFQGDKVLYMPAYF